MIYRFDTLTSTNDEARDARYRHGDLILAERQTAGRGQRGHTWISPEGTNLTFTLVVEPTFLAARDQFLLSEVVALALGDCLDRFGIPTRIKWTNDIYYGDYKLVGILIEHFYSGSRLQRTLVGIGLNVNQTEFDPTLPNPVSMRQILQQEVNRDEVLKTFSEAFAVRYAQLEQGARERIGHDYRSRLYRLGEEHPFTLADRTPIRATIEGVEEGGELILRHADSTRHTYRFKEVEFVVKKAAFRLLLEK